MVIFNCWEASKNPGTFWNWTNTLFDESSMIDSFVLKHIEGKKKDIGHCTAIWKTISSVSIQKVEVLVHPPKRQTAPCSLPESKYRRFALFFKQPNTLAKGLTSSKSKSLPNHVEAVHVRKEKVSGLVV